MMYASGWLLVLGIVAFASCVLVAILRGDA